MRAGSLAHESIISILNRRFVSTYFDTYQGPAFDAEGAAFAKAQPQHLKYGAIFTPAGELVVTFGFNPVEVYLAMLYAVRAHPKITELTPEESAVHARAHDNAAEPSALMAGAVQAVELLDFTGARSLLDRLLNMDVTADQRNRALHLRGRTHLLDLGNFDAQAVHADFDRIDNPEPSLAFELEIDRILLNTTPKPHVFFGGWTFRADVNIAAIQRRLEHLIEHQPTHRRIGEAHFLLGLTLAAQDHLADAARVWARHIERWPQDRTAVLSHLHHPDYSFSPLGRPGGGVAGISDGALGDAAPGLVEQLNALGVDVRDSREAVTPGLATIRNSLQELRSRFKLQTSGK